MDSMVKPWNDGAEELNIDTIVSCAYKQRHFTATLPCYFAATLQRHLRQPNNVIPRLDRGIHTRLQDSMVKVLHDSNF
jgi:hypothetical protein